MHFHTLFISFSLIFTYTISAESRAPPALPVRSSAALLVRHRPRLSIGSVLSIAAGRAK
ncbi:hypothetical protein GcM1_c14701o16 [Golovinomyces cichoracearum]|uniref:Secreted effector protein n=1 Tax=Golovinomyces cichoracearum TaxID=62708 RepID=A0A420IUS2_9PEZI|nr:hypothetical protein GcM1_c14701o16 [Golovinomyces cichoracearum]